MYLMALEERPSIHKKKKESKYIFYLVLKQIITNKYTAKDKQTVFDSLEF
jgi:hypothetical protein